MPPATSPAAQAVDAAARALLARRRRVVLAVSGGLDSMCLLEAVGAALRADPPARHRVDVRRRVTVVTFDHRTGPHSTRAAALVAMRARELELPLVAGRLGPSADGVPREAALREERWRFLRRVALERDAVVATAHTRDDQVETVVMRALRGAGARGLAGLFADAEIERPLLDLDRETLACYAREQAVQWQEDPSNATRAYLRNRVRLDLLPALRRARPAFDEEMLALARRAAAWRRDVEHLAAGIGSAAGAQELHVAVEELAGYDLESLRVLWPALAARVGATLDRRGTWRLAEFTTTGVTGRAIQLSGGWEVVRHRSAWVLRRARGQRNFGDVAAVSLRGETRVGAWRFRPVDDAGGDLWRAALPGDATLSVRPWRAGDRIRGAGGVSRRVKRFLSDAGIAGPDRAGWPVVLVGSEIVWIPGVRRSDAATVRPGGPVTCFVCERIDG